MNEIEAKKLFDKWRSGEVDARELLAMDFKTDVEIRIEALRAATALTVASNPNKMSAPVKTTLTVAKQFAAYLESGE